MAYETFKRNKEPKITLKGQEKRSNAINEVCYTVHGIAFTKPVLKVRYDKKKAKNIFFIDFCYLTNGVLQSYTVNMEAINMIRDTKVRMKNALSVCDRISVSLYRGASPKKIIEGSNDEVVLIDIKLLKEI